MSYHMTLADAKRLADGLLNPGRYSVETYRNRHDFGADDRSGRKYGVWDRKENCWVFGPRGDEFGEYLEDMRVLAEIRNRK